MRRGELRRGELEPAERVAGRSFVGAGGGRSVASNR